MNKTALAPFSDICCPTHLLPGRRQRSNCSFLASTQRLLYSNQQSVAMRTEHHTCCRIEVNNKSSFSDIRHPFSSSFQHLIIQLPSPKPSSQCILNLLITLSSYMQWSFQPSAHPSRKLVSLTHHAMTTCSLAEPSFVCFDGMYHRPDRHAVCT